MMHVTQAPEPSDFHGKVRAPGMQCIAERVGRKPNPPRRKGSPWQQWKFEELQSDGTLMKIPVTREDDLPRAAFSPYWTEALGDLMASYHGICAYSCFRIHPVTGARSVDHMAALSLNWQRVYEWDNYRLACALLNSRKGKFEDVLDPFTVDDSWFTLEFVGFQVLPAAHLAPELQGQIRATVDRLGLDDFRRQRESDAEDYWAGEISLKVLERESPFVARELRRQGRLNPGDV